MDWSHVFGYFLISFAFNLPLGKWRSMQRRLSFWWFVAVHLSVPFVFLLRFYWDLPLWLIPFAVGIAVLAQFLGGMIQLGRWSVYK